MPKPGAARENAARAAELAQRGLSRSEIASRLGRSEARVKVLLADPNGRLQERAIQREMQAKEDAITCELCGVLRHVLHRHLVAVHNLTPAMYAKQFPEAPLSSAHVRAVHRDLYADLHGRDPEDPRLWPPERILAAIRRFTRRYGRPPSYEGWQQTSSRDEWPHPLTVASAFGSWSEALALAGVPGRTPQRNCKRGHPLEGDNLYVWPNGKRGCRTCMKAYDVARRAKQPKKPRSRPPTCRKGHAYTPENTYIRPDGARICRQCQREKWRRRYYRLKGAA